MKGGWLLTSDHSCKARDIIRLDLHPIGEKVVAYWPYLIRSGSEKGTGPERTFDFTRFRRLFEIAGGLATLLSDALEQHRDLDHVIQRAKSNDPDEFLWKRIEPSRREFVSGDMLNAESIHTGTFCI